VLLNIWGTFCVPCRVEMPSLEALHKDSATQGLKIVAVSIDDRGLEEKVRRFAHDYGLTFDILYDPSGDIETRYQTTGVPETFIIGRDGVIRRKVIGASDWTGQPHRALIAQLLAERSRREMRSPATPGFAGAAGAALTDTFHCWPRRSCRSLGG
jgi:peroxiredoxin